MRWVWIISLPIILVGSAYFWLKPRDLVKPSSREARTELSEVRSLPVEPQVEESKAIALEAKLKETKPILRQRERLRKELADDPHGTPSAIMQAGQALGEVEELQKQYPDRKDEFIRYYQECFENPETMVVTRVQCFRRYVSTVNPTETEKENALADLPLPVQKLYRKFEASR